MLPTTLDQLKESLDLTVKELDGAYDKYCRRSSRLSGLPGFIRIPHQEIRHIWLANYSILKLTVNALGIAPPKQEEERMRALLAVANCLHKAGRTRNLADAWSFLNTSTAYLIKGVQDKDLQAASIGLLSSDKSLSKASFDRIVDTERRWGLSTKEGDTAPRLPDRSQLFSRLLLRSYVWDVANRRIWLRIRLLRKFGALLLLFLVAAVLLSAAVLRTQFSPIYVPWYIATPLLGAFGGSLSASIRARKSLVSAVSYRLIITVLLLRMLLGAAGAFIVYIALNWPGNLYI